MQRKFWREANKPYNIKWGAVRSGKTYMDYFLIPKRLIATHGKPGLRVLLGNTRNTLERNIIQPMRDMYGDDLVGRSGPNFVNMFGEHVFALGADRISQVSKLQGSGIIYCYGDEITTWNEDVFQMLKSRLSYQDSIFDGTCNPESPTHWLKDFIEKSDSDYVYTLQFNIWDNPKLPREFVENLVKEYQGTVYYNRFILGEWAVAEGLIYQCYDVLNDPLDDVPENLTGRRFASVDYGTANACVFLLFEEGISGTWYVTDEYYYSGRDNYLQKTDEQYCKDFEHFTMGRPVSSVVIDPSALSFIAAMRYHGFSVIEADNHVLDGIRQTMTKLNLGEIKILRKCQNLLREFGAYRWNAEKGVDEPIKENDHCCDALRYFVSTFEYLSYDPFT